MKTLELKYHETTVKKGYLPEALEPNVFEDCLLVEDGKPIGFFIRKVPEKLGKLIAIANKEFRSKRVPKTEMSRGAQGTKADKLARRKAGIKLVTQYSAILGGVPPKPHMKRNYPTISSVNAVESAQTFVKAMLLACKESESLIKQIMPEQYERQLKALKTTYPPYKFGNLFTSSISNFNIPAPYHLDTANIKDTVNVIITKRFNSSGGNLHVPDYNAVFDQCDGSILVYPAWKNVHGVTPIKKQSAEGYRNSFIFYPLKAFKGVKE